MKLYSGKRKKYFFTASLNNSISQISVDSFHSCRNEIKAADQ